MKKWFLSRSKADRIAMILIAAIVLIGGTVATVIAIRPSKTLVTDVASIEETVASVTDAVVEPVKEEEKIEKEEKQEKEEVLGVNKAEETATDEIPEPFVKKGYDLINGNFADGLNGFEFYAFSSDDASYELNGNGIDINISNTGTEDWHVQLKQNDVKLESGKWYRLSLDAKSTLNRKATMTMQKNGMADDDWTPYCNQEVLSLTKNWQHYQVIFKMEKNTDKNAVFNISMGTVGGSKITKAHTVSINNINLEKLPDNFTDSLKTNGNLVGNGDFSNQSILWDTVVVEPGKADVSFDNNKAVFKIDNPGFLDWNVQLKQAGIKLNKYSGYRVTFNATSSEARTIKVGIMDSNYVTWYGGGDIYLDKERPTEVSVEFYNELADNNDAVLMISMGKIEGSHTPASTISISDVKFVKDSSVYIPVWQSGAAVAPTLPDGWSGYDHEGTHTSAIAAVANGAKFSIKNTGTEEWHVQYTKKPVSLNKGTTYKVEYDIVSTIDRTVKSMIQHNGGNWDTYYYEDVALKANEAKHVSSTFKVTKDDGDCVFNFSLGTTADATIDVPHDITITNVSYSVEKVDLDNGNNPGIGDLVTYVVEADAPKNGEGIWDLELSSVVDYSEYIGKKVRFTCTIYSEADFKAQVTGLSDLPDNPWSWNNPTAGNFVEFTEGVGGTKNFECVIENFKKPVVQILARDEVNPQEIVVSKIKFFDETEEAPTEPAEEGTVVLAANAEKNNNNNTNWDIDLSSVLNFAEYEGKTVKFSATVSSGSAFSGCITGLSGASYSWNEPTGDQRYEVSAGESKDVECIINDFKKPVIQIWWKDETNPSAIKVSNLKLEEVQVDLVAPSTEKVLLAKDADRNLTDEYGSKWKIDLDPEPYDFSEYVGKKVRATAVLQSDSWFGGEIVAQAHADYSGWIPSGQIDVDGSGTPSNWVIETEDFKKLIIMIYYKDEENPCDIMLKSLSFEVIE